jgi:hypothetical protein
VIAQRAAAQIISRQEISQFAKNLGTPTGFGNRIGPNGQEFVSQADDPITGAKGGWFQVVGGNLQRVGADGQPAVAHDHIFFFLPPVDCPIRANRAIQTASGACTPRSNFQYFFKWFYIQ